MQGGDGEARAILPCIYHRPASSFACGFFVTVGGVPSCVVAGCGYCSAGTAFHENTGHEIPAEYGLPLCGWPGGVCRDGLAGGGTSRVGGRDRDSSGRGMK